MHPRKKSKEQEAADKFLTELEAVVDECIEVFNAGDTERVTELQGEIKEMGNEYKSIHADLTEADADAAAQFTEDFIAISQKLVNAMS